MDHAEFEQILEEQIDKIRSSLGAKAREYASDGDRMHNFMVSAAFKGETPEQALWGFQVKHLVSIRDMVKSGEIYSEERWDEKLGDAINYFILLRALVVETAKQRSIGDETVDISAASSASDARLYSQLNPQNGSDSEVNIISPVGPHNV